MARPKKRIPEMHYHSARERFYIRIGGKWHYLDKDKNVAQGEADRLVGQFLLGAPQGDVSPSETISITEVANPYMAYLEQNRYSKESETLGDIRVALKPLRELYGRTRAADFNQESL